MSKLLFTLLAALVLTVPGARAEQDQPAKDEHAGHHPSEAQPPGTKEHSPAEHLQANMKAMHDVMARLRDTADPAEKKRLLRVHLLAMQEQVQTMRSASAPAHDHSGASTAKDGGGESKGGDGTKDEGMMEGMMKGGMMKGGMMKMHKQVEGRLDAIEGLLEQLIEHQAAQDALGSQ
jgi:hypothetical protein